MQVNRGDLLVRQLEVLRHSLGIGDDGRGKSYRNYFVAGGKDVETCRSLVRIGLMIEGRSSDMTGGDPCFHVTETGQQIAKG